MSVSAQQYQDEFEVSIDNATLMVRRLQANSPLEKAPTLVFLHDSLGCINLWRDFPQRLADETGCNALVYDRQGYGRSSPFVTTVRTKTYMDHEAHVLLRLLDQCDVEKSILFGHSDGGTISLMAAAFRPERFVGVITEGAHVFVEDVTLQGLRAAREQYRTTDLPQRLRKYHGDKTEDVFAAWVDIWLDEAYRDWNMEYLLPDIKCPVLVIQGENDEYGTLDQVDAIAGQVSGPAEKFMVPDVGHTPHKEAPRTTLQACAAFIRSIAGAPD